MSMNGLLQVEEIFCEPDKLIQIIGPDSFCWNRGVAYMNVFGSFDIETTFYVKDNMKLASMYMWQISINHVFIYGRTWTDMVKLFALISDEYGLGPKRRFVIYVHNLSYEFNWIHKYFEWIKVFAREEGSPIRALTTTGIEFRCSYQLSGKSLRSLCADYNLPTRKGHLNYLVMRFWWSELEQETIEYARSDVFAVEEYVKTQIERCGTIADIPYTRTSYVRRAVKDACYAAKGYKSFISNLKILSVDNYSALRRAYQGGFTHANSWRVGRVYNDVGSYDLTSSYPAVMCSELFPMSTPELFTTLLQDEYLQLIKTHAVVADFEFWNLESKTEIDNIISASKCWELSGARRNGILYDGKYVADNGRIDSCDRCCITLTEVDFMLVQRFYTIEKWRVFNAYVYKLGYLPKPIIDVILSAYAKKTELKGVDGREQDYLIGKEYVNAIYGMTVTDICRDDVCYLPNHTWTTLNADVAKKIDKYHGEYQRTLYYPWGVYVTAYARKNLLQTMLEVGDDYLYSDTDSIKLLNPNRHIDIFNRYNERIRTKVSDCLIHYSIPVEKASPLDNYGTPHPLGVWDFEGYYDKFKCLRAKCYMTLQNGKLKTTIAGCNKEGGGDYMATFDDPFAAFEWGLDIPADYAGRMVALYIDEPTTGTISDFRGMEGTWCEESSVVLIPTQYHLNLMTEYADFLKIFRVKVYDD